MLITKLSLPLLIQTVQVCDATKASVYSTAGNQKNMLSIGREIEIVITIIHE
jgi:hypothetical protein